MMNWRRLIQVSLLALAETAYAQQTITVVNTQPGGKGSLSEAVRTAEKLPGDSGRVSIVFRIPKTDPGFNAKAGVWSIRMDAPLILQRGKVEIDGTTQSKFADANPLGPEITLMPAKPGVEHPVALVSAENSVRGLAVNSFKYGLVLYGAGATSNTVADCLISGNQTGIILVEGAGRNTIEDNVISGNTSLGVYIAGSGIQNLLRRNKIGVDAAGVQRQPNGIGVLIDRAARQVIGEASAGNTISGNDDVGVAIVGKSATGNVIAGNHIGVDGKGLKELHNNIGIVIKALASENVIGGTGANAGNVISGNSQIGIYIEAADNNRILGNLIGTDSTGSRIPAGKVIQGNGIEFNTVAKGNVLGGTGISERNVISGHTVYGVVYYGHCSNNSTIGNYIGTDSSGEKPLPNATGICVDCASHHNDIASNVISGNLSYGLFFVTRGTEFNTLRGNFIGTDPSGQVAVPNDIGLVIATGASNNRVGSDKAEDSNTISGNRQAGVMITNRYTRGNELVGNYIGVDFTGRKPLPNLHGVVVSTYPRENVIKGNVISGNHQSGLILYEYAEANQVKGNRIGVSADDKPMGNGGVGVVLDERSEKLNAIGPDAGNIIRDNRLGQTLVQRVADRGPTLGAATRPALEPDPGLAAAIKDWGPVIGGMPPPRPTAATRPVPRRTIRVTSTSDAGPGSLRDAITRANAAGGDTAIVFAIPVSDPNFDRRTGVWTIAPTTALPPIVAPGIMIDASTAGDMNPSGPDVLLSGGKHAVEHGLMVLETRRTTIRGLAIDGFVYGIQIYGKNARDNVIAGCYIGLLPTGAQGAGNFNGVEIISGAQDNLIGGEDAADRNVVSGNLHTGVRISDASRNLVVGNFIGVDPAGKVALPNFDGVAAEGRSADNQIGGPRPSQRNIISGNVAYGVDLFGHQVRGNLVYGNYIGTDVTGQLAIPNTYGLLFDDRSHDNVVGGLEPGQGNLISGNTAFGAYFYNNGTRANIVRGNLIGTDATGTRAIPNETGVHVDGVTVDNVIDRNLISGNLVAGITLFARGTDRNAITGNLVGTDGTGLLALGNGEDGIRLAFGPSSNRIDGNVIACNGGAGVYIESETSQNNRITGNFMFANAVSGIDLAPPGATPNDRGDRDSGPNAMMNSPVIVEASFAGGVLRVSGMLDTPSPQDATVELFRADRHGVIQGKVPLGLAKPDAQGRWSIELRDIPGPINALACTATDARGNTSEFSGWRR